MAAYHRSKFWGIKTTFIQQGH